MTMEDVTWQFMTYGPSFGGELCEPWCVDEDLAGSAWRDTCGGTRRVVPGSGRDSRGVPKFDWRAASLSNGRSTEACRDGHASRGFLQLQTLRGHRRRQAEVDLGHGPGCRSDGRA